MIKGAKAISKANKLIMSADHSINDIMTPYDYLTLGIKQVVNISAMRSNFIIPFSNGKLVL